MKDRTGEIGCLRFNQLYPPFNNPAIRRVVVAAMDQKEVMEGVAGAEPSLYRTDVGLFVPERRWPAPPGIEITRGPKDYAKAEAGIWPPPATTAKRSLSWQPPTIPTIWAEAQVATDILSKIGFNIDLQAMDWGSVVQRRASREPVDKGGWNIFYTFLGGFGNISPAPNIAIRGNGTAALVRLAHQRKVRGTLQCLVRCTRSGRAKKDLRGHANCVLAKSDLCTARHV